MCVTDHVLHRSTPDKALMGAAHASSGLAVFVVILCFAPALATWLVGSFTPVMVVLGAFAFVAGALIPDFDNTASTVKSAVGVLGAPVSGLFRGASSVVQRWRTKYDPPPEDVHRGFWHSLAGAVTLGALVWGVTSVSVPVGGVLGFDTVGSLCGFVLLVYCAHIALAGLSADVLKKMKNAREKHSVVSFLVSVVGVYALFWFLPTQAAGSFLWLSVCVGLGAVVHILGDALTVQGVPLFAPLIKIRGKRWFDIRFAMFHAHDEGLNRTVNGLSVLVIVGSLILVFLLR